MQQQLNVQQRSGCTVLKATGTDPYTGAALYVDDIDIDHIVPLAAAWDLGAWRWTRSQRIAFANDQVRNLVVTAASINRDKSDATAEAWMPPEQKFHCWYAQAYLAVIDYWKLSLTQRDAQVLSQACRRWIWR